MKHLIITETKAQKGVIEKVLSNEILDKTNILVGGGFEPSLSLARSFRLKRNENVVLIHDANKVDENVLKQQLEEATDFVRMIISKGEFLIIPFKPNLETVIKNQIPDENRGLIGMFKKKPREEGTVDLKLGLKNERSGKKEKPISLSPGTLKKIRNRQEIKQIVTLIN